MRRVYSAIHWSLPIAIRLPSAPLIEMRSFSPTMTIAMLNGCAPIAFSSAATLASKPEPATLANRAHLALDIQPDVGVEGLYKAAEQSVGERVAENSDLIDIVVRERRQKRAAADHRHRRSPEQPTRASAAPAMKRSRSRSVSNGLSSGRGAFGERLSASRERYCARTIQRRGARSNASSGRQRSAFELACASTPSDGQQSILSPLAF